jgi:hypothetical protein
MDIHQRDEGQKARSKISVKNTADDPSPGDKQRDPAGNQCQEITGKRPTRIASRAGLFFLVVAGKMTRAKKFLLYATHGVNPRNGPYRFVSAPY